MNITIAMIEIIEELEGLEDKQHTTVIVDNQTVNINELIDEICYEGLLLRVKETGVYETINFLDEVMRNKEKFKHYYGKIKKYIEMGGASLVISQESYRPNVEEDLDSIEFWDNPKMYYTIRRDLIVDKRYENKYIIGVLQEHMYFLELKKNNSNPLNDGEKGETYNEYYEFTTSGKENLADSLVRIEEEFHLIENKPKAFRLLKNLEKNNPKNIFCILKIVKKNDDYELIILNE